MNWPFKRKQTETDRAPAMPPELTDYYQAEKRQQTIVTWLLGFATLAITIAVAFGLFLGARWVVNKVRKNPDNKPTTTQNEPKTSGAPGTPAKPESPSSNTATGTPAAPGSQSNQPSTSGANTTGTPQTSSATTTLPNTGPTETIAVFTLATLAGTALHVVTRKRA